jgi:hypothetical protein
MPTSQKTNGKQMADKRENGTFAPGHKLGNRFKKGESGNSAGRPKLTRLTDSLRQLIAETNPDADDKTIAETIAQTLVTMALSGDLGAIREVLDRTEGKPKVSVDLGVSVEDWRTTAENAGLTEQEFINESKLYVASLEASLICE